jgi:hypothetical protein
MQKELAEMNKPQLIEFKLNAQSLNLLSLISFLLQYIELKEEIALILDVFSV